MTDQPNNARLVADLQALTLALHIGGLDGLRNGSVVLTTQSQPNPEGREEN